MINFFKKHTRDNSLLRQWTYVAWLHHQGLNDGLVGECRALDPVDVDAAQRDQPHQKPGEGASLGEQVHST